MSHKLFAQPNNAASQISTSKLISIIGLIMILTPIILLPLSGLFPIMAIFFVVFFIYAKGFWPVLVWELIGILFFANFIFIKKK